MLLTQTGWGLLKCWVMSSIKSNSGEAAIAFGLVGVFVLLNWILRLLKLGLGGGHVRFGACVRLAVLLAAVGLITVSVF